MSRSTMPARRLSAATAIFAMTAALLAVLAVAPASAADRDCGDFASQRAAQLFYLRQGGPQLDPHGLDADDDGVACDSNPPPTYYGRTLPGKPKPDPKPKPKPPVVIESSVSMTINSVRRIAGERLRVVAKVRP